MKTYPTIIDRHRVIVDQIIKFFHPLLCYNIDFGIFGLHAITMAERSLHRHSLQDVGINTAAYACI